MHCGAFCEFIFKEEICMKEKWWHDKVAYQIYPKSFYDSNGDGIGDIAGIIEKLDYLKELGVDIIWLSPVFSSPLADQGYDISDYYGIDPRFGTMEDMDRLIDEAKKRGMYILMDLVVNHCSDEHEWFKEAIKDPEGKYGKYFYIEDIKDGKMPTNWRSYFGGSVWEPLPNHPDKCYLHVFHRKQPDLNWENKEVRDDVCKMVNWWLDKGLGGFRIDAIVNIKKAFPFKDYPADRPDGLSKIQNMLSDAKGIGVFLGELRDRTFAVHDSFSVGEVFDVPESEVPEFIGEDGYFSSMFDFSTAIIGKSDKGWYANKVVTAKEYIEAICESQQKMNGVGFYSNIIENHDEPRGVSRYLPEGEHSDKAKKTLALITLCLRGVPFIYQGQEIGMENMEFTSMEQIDDISSIDEYHVALEAGCTKEEALTAVSRFSRDNARTPMQWDNSEKAGFTKGKPWLAVNPKKDRINVASQVGDEESVLTFYKKLIALRKSDEYKHVMVYGSFVPCAEPERNVMAYIRDDGAKKLLVVANYQKEPQTFRFAGSVGKVVISNDDVKVVENEIELGGYQAVVVEMK
jgi:oligo-1,6-glucosidase